MNDRDIFRNVTKGIAFSVKAGIAPWQQVWIDKPPIYPVNGANGDPFGGINFLLLSSSGRTLDNRWLTRSEMVKRKLDFKDDEEVDNGVSVVTRWKEDYEVEKKDGSGEMETKSTWKSRIGRLYNAEQIKGISEPDDFNGIGFANPDDLDAFLTSTNAKVDLDGTSPAYLYEHKTVCMPPKDGTILWYTDLVRMLARHTANSEDDTVARNVVSEKGRVGVREWLTTEMATYMICAELGLPYRPAIDSPTDDAVIRFLDKHNNGAIFKMAADANNIRRYVSSMVIDNEMSVNAEMTLDDLFTDDKALITQKENEDSVQSKRSFSKLNF